MTHRHKTLIKIDSQITVDEFTITPGVYEGEEIISTYAAWSETSHSSRYLIYITPERVLSGNFPIQNTRIDADISNHIKFGTAHLC